MIIKIKRKNRSGCHFFALAQKNIKDKIYAQKVYAKICTREKYNFSAWIKETHLYVSKTLNFTIFSLIRTNFISSLREN